MLYPRTNQNIRDMVESAASFSTLYNDGIRNR